MLTYTVYSIYTLPTCIYFFLPCVLMSRLSFNHLYNCLWLHMHSNYFKIKIIIVCVVILECETSCEPNKLLVYVIDIHINELSHSLLVHPLFILKFAY